MIAISALRINFWNATLIYHFIFLIYLLYCTYLSLTSLSYLDFRDQACCSVDESLSLKHITQMHEGNVYVPPEKREPTPVETFLRTVHIASRYHGIGLVDLMLLIE